MKKRENFILNTEMPATETPSANNRIHHIHENGIVLLTKRTAVRGYITSISFLVLLIAPFYICFGLPNSFEEIIYHSHSIGEYLIKALILIVLPLLWTYAATIEIGAEIFSYIECLLFDRNSQTISIAHVQKSKWKPFSKKHLIIKSYPWSDVHAELYGQGEVEADHWTLTLEIINRIEPEKVIESVKIDSGLNKKESLEKLWEHIRRYMNGSGPCLQESDSLSDENLNSPWSAFLYNWLPVRHPFLLVLHLVFFPLSIWVGIMSALIVMTKKEWDWPADVRQSIGKVFLSEAEARASIKDSETFLTAPINLVP